MNLPSCSLRYPVIFVNHGGGPLPLLGQQPEIVKQLEDVRNKYLQIESKNQKPKAIVVFSAHWESNPIKIMSSSKPTMYYDYGGFPPESYEYQYAAPGSPDLAEKIKLLLSEEGLESELDDQRGFDHGVFVPLMIMFPEADIPVVAVSLHSSLSAGENIRIGKALTSLRNEEILFVGSGQSFHNMKAFFNPTSNTINSSKEFNEWLKATITIEGEDDDEENIHEKMLTKLTTWGETSFGQFCHPREEHLLPLFVCAGLAGKDSKPQIIFDSDSMSHRISSYAFL